MRVTSRAAQARLCRRRLGSDFSRDDEHGGGGGGRRAAGAAQDSARDGRSRLRCSSTAAHQADGGRTYWNLSVEGKDSSTVGLNLKATPSQGSLNSSAVQGKRRGVELGSSRIKDELPVGST